MYMDLSILSKLSGILLDNKKQLKIIYLFMKTDGECSKEEMERFNELCQSKHISTSEKYEIIGYGESMFWQNNADNSHQAIAEIKKILDEYNHTSIRTSDDKLVEANLVWTLLNLAYADNEYSEGEKKVINYLVSFLKIDKGLMLEFNNTVQTILRLSNQIEWIKTTNIGYDKINESIKEYKKNINELFHNIEIAILETNIKEGE